MIPAQRLLMSGSGSGGGHSYEHYHSRAEAHYRKWLDHYRSSPETPPTTDVEAVFLKSQELMATRRELRPFGMYTSDNTFSFTYHGQKLMICTEPMYQKLARKNQRADRSIMAGFYSMFNRSFVEKKTAQRAALAALAAAREPEFHGERDPSTGAIIITTQHRFRIVVWTYAECMRYL